MLFGQSLRERNIVMKNIVVVPQEIREQSERLHEFFPNTVGHINHDLLQRFENTHPILPSGAVWSVIPIWIFTGDSYENALMKVLESLKIAYGSLKNYREDTLGNGNLRETVGKASAMQMVLEKQDTGITTLFPIHFFCDIGEQTDMNDSDPSKSIAFPIGAYEVAMALLVHREYFQSLGDVRIFCSGDQYRETHNRDSTRVPYFEFKEGKLEFGTDFARNIPNTAMAFILP